jgi:hypothetical protein
LYAVQIPASQIAAFMPGEDIVVHSALFETFVLDASVVPLFADAMITTGAVTPNGTAVIDLANPLDGQHFVGQDGDFAPLFARHPRQLARIIREGIASGAIENIFLVLRLPTTAPFPGVSGQPPQIGLSLSAPLFGRSFMSADGVTFNRFAPANFRFSLVLAKQPE